jgi:hypothetical protein
MAVGVRGCNNCRLVALILQMNHFQKGKYRSPSLRGGAVFFMPRFQPQWAQPSRCEDSMDFYPIHTEARILVERALQRAMAHSTMLRRAFQLSLDRHGDADNWKLLDSAVGRVLERNASCDDEQWFTAADGRLRESVTSLFNSRGCGSTEAWQYRRSVEQVYECAAARSQELDEVTVAYWRHSALVWITLWHLADVPGVTVFQAKECLEVCFDEESACKEACEVVRPQKRTGWSLSEVA